VVDVPVADGYVVMEIHMANSIYIVAGEMSGDAHAAGLLKSLKKQLPDLLVHGCGGPEMEELSEYKVENWVADAAVMGFWEVLKHYSWFKKKFDAMLADFIKLQPEVLLLVDYPGFNLRFAKAARKAQPKVKIIYYISPQVWAWNKGRIPKMVEILDEMMCLFPFEQKIFQDAGLKTTFVGHPLVDELDEQKIVTKRDDQLVGLFPGSREREVSRLFPVMLDAAGELLKEGKNLYFSVPAATPELEVILHQLIKDKNLTEKVEVTKQKSHSLMQRASCAVIASGTATLEAAYYGLPYCLVYKIAWPTYFLGKILVKIEHIGLINILANRKIVKEFIQLDANRENIYHCLREFIEKADYRQNISKQLLEAALLLGDEGAHERAANCVADWIIKK
jgi:lipid-A-disaccharide synthase